MAQLKLFFLGSPQLEVDGVGIECDSKKGLALLAYLAVTGQSHSRDALSTLLWPEHDQSRARSYLRHALWSLKKVLGEGWLEVSREQVMLKPEADIWLDVTEFQQRLKDSLTDDISSEDLTPLVEAVELYRGDFLAGFTLPDAPEFDEWQFFQMEDLRQKLAGALERLVWGYSHQGEYETAIPHARRWVALDPLHEPAQRVLMQLYAEAGQQAAALRQYEQYVDLLEEELGVPPEKELQTLAEAIKAKRLVEPFLKAETRENKGVGFSVLPLRRSPDPVEYDAPCHNLPAHPTPFVGREKELDEINQLLLNEPNCRLLTLIGPGGIGKTRLAIQAAQKLSESQVAHQMFADGIIFVPLAAVGNVSGIVSAIAEGVNFTFYDELPPRQQLLDFLRRKQLLLVVDNFEHLLRPKDAPDSLALLSDILAEAPDIKILATSREGLNLQETWFQPVTGLSFPEGDTIAALAANSYDAVWLFEQSARRAQPGFSLDAEREYVVRICRLVEGMPLAIELAAAWLKALTAKTVADEIERNLDILTAQHQNLTGRHQSMRVVLEQSWALLDEAEQAVLKRLTVFQGGFHQEAAVNISDASLVALLSLVDKSWLRLAGSGRYQLHELIRQFATEKLKETPEIHQATLARHAQYFLAFLQQRASSITGKTQSVTLAEIRAELENVQAAWRWAVDQQQIETIDQVLETVFDFYWISSLFHEGAAAFSAATEGFQTADLSTHTEVVIGKAQARLGAFLIALGRYDVAKELLQKSLELTRRQNNRREEAFVLNMLGEASGIQGQYKQAQQLFQASLEISQDIDYQPGMARSLQKLAWTVEEEQGDYLTAKQYLQQSLSLYQTLGRQAEIAFCLDKLAHNAWKRGDYTESENVHRESLAMFRKIGDRVGIANNLGGLGLIAMSRGGAYLPEAKSLMEESLAVCRETGHQREEANRLRLLGMRAIIAEEYEAAIAFAQQAMAIAKKTGYNHGVIMCLADLGEIALGQADFENARYYLQQVMQYNSLYKLKVAEAIALIIWATLLIKDSKPAVSQVSPQSELSLLKQEQAVEILSMVINHPATWYMYKEKAARQIAELKTQLPPERFATAESRGKSRKWDEIIREILNNGARAI